ncbi:MAG: light-harvesting protein [Roseibium sp.]|nr:light-harvesting protein [Roseibium sp.]
MNNSKIWLVVKPTVGIPLFLSAVAVGSFAVHVAVLTNTGWVGDFLSGEPLGASSASLGAPMTTAAAEGLAPVQANATGQAIGAAGQTITIVLPDGRTATAVIDAPLTTAAASLAAPAGQIKPE